MPNINNTPLNQQIQDAIAQQSTIGEELKQRYTDQPAYESQARADIFGGDSTLKGLQGGFSDKVVEMFNYDRQANARYSQPESETFIEDPFRRSQLVNAGFSQATQEKEAAWQLYETRKNVLGDALDKAIKLYETKTKLKESERASIKDQIDSLQALYAEENDKAYKDGLLSIEEKKAANEGKGITGDTEIDSLRDEEAVSIAETQLGLKFTGGTIAERGARARAALSEYKEKGSVSTSRYLDQLAPAAETSVSSLTDVIKRANDLTESLSRGVEMTGLITGRTSKFMADIFGKTGDASMIGKELEEMSADKIKERYGGALTATEVSRLTRQAITGRNVQEASNVESLAIMRKNAISLIEEKLRAAGWKQQAIDQYLREINATGNAGKTQDGWVDEGFVEQ